MREAISVVAVTLAGAVAAAGLSSGAAAQAFPSKPMTMIVANPAGAGFTIALRQIADQVQVKTGSTIIFDYVIGAAGSIAPARVKRAEPDGHTIGMIYSSPMALNPLLAKEPQYDPLKDFTYITMLTQFGLVIVGTPTLGANNLQELVALAKAKPNTVKFGYASNGPLIAILQIEAIAGVKFFQVPYKTGEQANAAAMSGEVDFVSSSMGNIIGSVKGGRVKPLFIGSRNRSPAVPQMQSVSELYPSLELVSWYGLYGPAAMPAERVNWHYREWTAAVKDPKIASYIENSLALDVVGSTPQVLLDQVRRELAANTVTVKQHNITE